jgi:succinate-semialdehyde dehydrogenase/glutarate-semialdehyde dehydrogenase
MKLSNPALLKQSCLINGAWTGTPSLDVTNPATGDVLARVPNFGAAEATAAVDAAAAAFPLWAAKTAKERSAVLRRWFDLIIRNKEDLAVLMTSEQGKPLAESRGEIEYAAGFIEFYAEEAKRLYGETIPSPWAGSRIMVLRQPAGVVAAITPWNFPAAMITRKVGPALAAGCTAVVKPAGATPLTALALAVLGQEAGLPPGVLNVVTGASGPIGEVLTTHDAVRVVTFTGSTEIGRVLMRQAAEGIKKVGLELGGNAPFIVFDDADIDAAVEGAIQSKFRNMGQTCVCANRLYVQASVHDAFVEKLIAATARLKVGNGLDEGVTQGPLVTESAVDKVKEHIEDATSHGAEIRVGGQAHTLGRTFFEPTVLTGVTQSMKIAREETFGPVAAVFRFDSEDEVIRYANDTEFGLAAYFYARDVGRIFRVAERLDYGIVGVNAGVISTEVAPFGGVKQSGIGREGSRHGVEEYTELKYVMLGGLGT